MGLRGKVLFGLVVFLVLFSLKFLCANCEKINSEDLIAAGPTALASIASTLTSDVNRRQQHQLWQSVGSSLSVQDDTVQPNDQSTSDDDNIQTIKRRRPANGRKRKRRPQIYSTERVEVDPVQKHWRGQVHDEPLINENRFSTTVATTRLSSQSRVRLLYSTTPAPIKFVERIREPLAALEKEQKLSELRDKQRKEFSVTPSSSSSSEALNNYRDKSSRKPYSQKNKENFGVQKENNDQLKIRSTLSTHTSRPAFDLKNILKNSGGLSLSEILQQKNLSLDDLLKGKHNALQAIQTTTSVPSVDNNSSKSSKYTKPQRKFQGSISNPTLSTNLNNKNIETIEVKSSLQAAIKSPTNINVSLKNFNNRYIVTTTKLTPTVMEPITEKTANVNEMATIVTLRDNPPIRKNIFHPSRSKLNIFSTSTYASDSTNRGLESNGLTNKVRTKPPKPIKTTTVKTTTTITTAIPAYRKRASLRPKLKFPNLSKPVRYDSSASSASLSSSESNSNENKQSIEDLETFSSNEEQNDFIPNFEFSSPTSNFTPTKSEEESVEEKLKQSKPEENFVDDFDDVSENPTSSQVVTLEELFGDTSFKTDSTENSKEQYTSSQQENSDEDAQNHKMINRQPQKNKKEQLHKNRNESQEHNTEQVDDSNESSNYPITTKKQNIVKNYPSAFLDLRSDAMIDDRSDLLELMEDRRSGNRLFKVLAQRNMTLEELIEHRKRGSSQLHLAQIINNTPKELPATLRNEDDFDIVTAFENFPHFNLLNIKSVKPDEIKTDSQGASYFTSIVDIEPTDEVYRDGKSLKVPSIHDPKPPHQKRGGKLAKSINFTPSWKSLPLASYAASNENSFLEQHNGGHHQRRAPPNDVDILDPILRIEDEVARAHDILDLELSGHGFKRNVNGVESIHIPAGIQSAIIASSAIVICSLIIFLFIFVMCRWKQRRRKKLRYIENYNAMKSKMPISSRQSTIKSFSVAGTETGTLNGNGGNVTTIGNATASGTNSDESFSSNTRIRRNSCTDRTCSHNMSSKSYNRTTARNTRRFSIMDPNSSELHDYLFDTMQKPY